MFNLTVRTDIQQNCAIVLLLDNVVLKDLVVQSLWRFHGRRHGGNKGSGPSSVVSQRKLEQLRVVGGEEEENRYYSKYVKLRAQPDESKIRIISYAGDTGSEVLLTGR